MAETLRKYRVRTVDGGVRLILAKNMHDAKSKARLEIGQLPNEVNLKILSKVLADLQDLQDTLKQKSINLKTEGKNLNWDEVNQEIKVISEQMNTYVNSFKELAGSMVKLKSDEEK